METIVKESVSACRLRIWEQCGLCGIIHAVFIVTLCFRNALGR